MRWRQPVWWLMCLAAAGTQAQEPGLLDKIKARTSENLRRLPDYTCTETIERFLRTDRRARLRPTDTIHLDVAYVEGKELFGHPGEHRIDEPDIGKFVGTPIGNGQFALFAKSIFLGRRATFGRAEKTKLRGRQAFRFDYAVPLAHSGFRIQSGVGEALVAYDGSFWVDRDTLDLMRLSISADLPPQLKMEYDLTMIDYAPVSIGGTLFPLPLRSRWETKDTFGLEARNVTSFENCHQFIGESVLKFGDAQSSSANK